MSREFLNRKFDCFWPNMTDEEKYIRIFNEEDIDILLHALALYEYNLVAISIDGVKAGVGFNKHLRQRLHRTKVLKLQMTPRQLFNFDSLMCENLAAES